MAAKEYDGKEDDQVTLRDIKHWMQNMATNVLEIAKTGQANRDRLEGIERTLDRSGHESRITFIEEWQEEMARHGTVANYGKLYEEAEKSKEFRTKTIAIWGVIVGAIAVMNLILTAVTLMKIFVTKTP